MHMKEFNWINRSSFANREVFIRPKYCMTLWFSSKRNVSNDPIFHEIVFPVSTKCESRSETAHQQHTNPFINLSSFVTFSGLSQRYFARVIRNSCETGALQTDKQWLTNECWMAIQWWFDCGTRQWIDNRLESMCHRRCQWDLVHIPIQTWIHQFQHNSANMQIAFDT